LKFQFTITKRQDIAGQSKTCTLRKIFTKIKKKNCIVLQRDNLVCNTAAGGSMELPARGGGVADDRGRRRRLGAHEDCAQGDQGKRELLAVGGVRRHALNRML